MAESKVDPATLTLRAPPRPVTRLNRRSLVVVVAVLAAGVLGATLWSLRSQRGVRDTPVELHNVDRVARADGLDQLPPDYSKLPAALTSPALPPGVPVLGHPLPGDLGGPMLRAEREIREPLSSGPGAPLRVDPGEDAARAERINRQREVEDAAKSALFFRSTSRKESAAMVPTGPAPPLAPAESASLLGIAPPVSAAVQSPQAQKQAFAQRASDARTQNTHAWQAPAAANTIMAGTVIPAALVTGINSDLPGTVIATVTQPVYDTATGQHVLIPQASRLIGQYDSQVSHGQARVLLVWTRLLLPDTSSITLDRLPGVDVAGYAGLEDRVDRHWAQLVAGAALSPLIGVAAELAAPNRTTGQSEVIISTRQSVQDSINQVGQELTRRNLDVQPTLTIRPGFPVRVVVNADIILRPYQPLFFDRSSP